MPNAVYLAGQARALMTYAVVGTLGKRGVHAAFVVPWIDRRHPYSQPWPAMRRKQTHAMRAAELSGGKCG